MAEQYSIKSRSHHCHLTGEPFTEDQPFVAALFPDPDSSGYLRHDFSLEAWKNRDPNEPKPFSFWRSTYKPPQKEAQVEVTPQDPESLFKKLVEEDEDHTENARFILAAMLERKKILKETDTQKVGDGLLRIYEHRKEGDVFIVRDPQIPLDQVDSIQEEVQQLLDPDHHETPDPSSTQNEEPSDQPDSTQNEHPAPEQSEQSEKPEPAEPETRDPLPPAHDDRK